MREEYHKQVTKQRWKQQNANARARKAQAMKKKANEDARKLKKAQKSAIRNKRIKQKRLAKEKLEQAKQQALADAERLQREHLLSLGFDDAVHADPTDLDAVRADDVAREEVQIANDRVAEAANGIRLMERANPLEQEDAIFNTFGNIQVLAHRQESAARERAALQQEIEDRARAEEEKAEENADWLRENRERLSKLAVRAVGELNDRGYTSPTQEQVDEVVFEMTTPIYASDALPALPNPEAAIQVPNPPMSEGYNSDAISIGGRSPDINLGPEEWGDLNDLNDDGVAHEEVYPRISEETRRQQQRENIERMVMNEEQRAIAGEYVGTFFHRSCYGGYNGWVW